MKTPSTYFSNFEGNWSVVHKGMPICNNKTTPREAMQAALQMRVMPTGLWLGATGTMIAIDATNVENEPVSSYLDGLNDYLTITARDGA